MYSFQIDEKAISFVIWANRSLQDKPTNQVVSRCYSCEKWKMISNIISAIYVLIKRGLKCFANILCPTKNFEYLPTKICGNWLTEYNDTISKIDSDTIPIPLLQMLLITWNTYRFTERCHLNVRQKFRICTFRLSQVDTINYLIEWLLFSWFVILKCSQFFRYSGFTYLLKYWQVLRYKNIGLRGKRWFGYWSNLLWINVRIWNIMKLPTYFVCSLLFSNLLDFVFTHFSNK